MKIFLMLIILIGSLTAHAQDQGTAIVYVNGVFTTKSKFRIANLEIKRQANQVSTMIDRNGLVFDGQYNRSFLRDPSDPGGSIVDYTDFMESAIQLGLQILPGISKQYLYSSWSEFLRLDSISESTTGDFDISLLQAEWERVKVDVMISGVTPLVEDAVLLSQKIGGYLSVGYKAILVSHSQGNFFANMSYGILQNSLSSAELTRFGNLGLALPTNGQDAPNGAYETMASDAILSVPLSAASSYAHDTNQWETFDEKGHGIIEIYLNPLLQAFKLSERNTLKNMTKWFQDNLIEVAGMLGGVDGGTACPGGIEILSGLSCVKIANSDVDPSRSLLSIDASSCVSSPEWGFEAGLQIDYNDWIRVYGGILVPSNGVIYADSIPFAPQPSNNKTYTSHSYIMDLFYLDWNWDIQSTRFAGEFNCHQESGWQLQ